MKKLAVLVIALCCFAACSKKDESNLNITGKVQGLKKGTLYLQKVEDTSLVTMDSIVIQGNPDFSLSAHIETPQILYLYLDKPGSSPYDDHILFFAEPGEMVINTTLQNFNTDAVVEGSNNQKKLMEYRQMMQRFNDRNLELIQNHFKAQQENDSELVDSTAKEYDNLLRRKYLFTVNFALNNKDLEVAPYLAISEIHDANIKYLDTIYKSLDPEIQESLYGQSLQSYLKERLEEEEKQKMVQ